ncbi:ATP-binding protein [Lusitaniella coriacea LEGE 07157]|uniref:ATP-binding protein n=1 Tax=Lusitaniella coriacea LEGE 07157 TaxID=945747 RepID=A0A8J7DZK1_9CYAN|nr:ATP-binding protein [Lusitaniella coriacea]MBE9116576.1 ATP-binding protein [Lusitaniella coriacea LEGE 07157]
MQQPTPNEHFKLQLPTELEALPQALQWFEKIALPLLPQQAYWQCQVALAEGFTNVVRHAHQGLPPTTSIDLEILLWDRCFEIRIWDWGKPFDLKAKLQELNPNNLNDPFYEGGRGLMFIQKLTDELHYCRQADKRNCLTMRKGLI